MATTNSQKHTAAETGLPQEGNAAKKARKEEVSIPSTGPSAHHYTSDRFLRMMINTKVDAVRPPDNKIFVAQRTDSIVEVFKGLIQHNFLSVPVLQKTKSKYYGFVDLYDIVKYVVQYFGESDELKSTEDFFTLANKTDEFKTKTVNDIMTYPLTRRNPFHPVNAGYSLFSAVELLARERGLHRVPIIDSDRKLVTIITQSQVVNILNRNMELIGEKRNKPVTFTRKFGEEVLCVSDDAIAIDAFRTMIDKNVSGLAVVNSEGKLIGNISLRDLKVMSADGRLFFRLYQTVKHYLQKVQKETTSDTRPRRLVSLKQNDTVETAIKTLSEHKVHRVYIVDDMQKPVGVLTLKDILLEIIDEFEPSP